MGYSHPEQYRLTKTPPSKNNSAMYPFNENESNAFDRNTQINRSASFGQFHEDSFEHELSSQPFDSEGAEEAAAYQQYRNRAPLTDCTNRSINPSLPRSTAPSSKRSLPKETLDRCSSQSKIKSSQHSKATIKTIEKTPSSRRTLLSNDQENIEMSADRSTSRTPQTSTRRLSRSPTFSTPVTVQTLEIQKLEKEIDALKRTVIYNALL